MARIRSGILGNIRGKVSGVVGGQWKDKNYLREYVKPANPNTAAQQVQRTKMSDCVTFCKPLVGPVFNAYTDKFQKSMSGFNFFIKQNILIFDGTPEYNLVLLTEGKLFPLASVESTYATGVPSGYIQWDEAQGNNGSLTDPVYGAIYDCVSGIWYFAAAEVTRDDEAIEIPMPAGLTSANCKAYAWALTKSGTMVTSLSNSGYAQTADA